MRRSLQWFAAALLTAPLCGCSAGQRIQQFFMGGPSPERQQQSAQQFDPYPEEDVGPQALGTRPPGFENNVAEPKRARWWKLPGTS